MLRLAFVVIGLAVGSIFALQLPIYALQLYLWIAYFRPDYWIWSDVLFGSGMSLYAGILVLVRTAFTPPKLSFGPGPVLLVAMLGQSALSTFASPYYSFSEPFFVDFAKSIAIAYLISVLCSDSSKLRLTILVISLSLGFEGAKQGWAQLLSNPGAKNINDSAAFGDNNGVAVGMLMLVPLLVALARTARKGWERWLHRILAFGVLYRGLSTYSRGGFIAAAVLGLVFLIRSPRKLVAIPVLLFAATVTLAVLPDDYWNRMNTITVEDGQQRDASAASRLYFWQVALDMGSDRPFLGVGHNAYVQAYNRYDSLRGLYGRDRSVHSSWFGALAELGVPGLLLLVANVIYALVGCQRVRRLAKSQGVSEELGHLATGVEASLIAAGVGGSFVIFQYNEMLWHLIGLSIAIRLLASYQLRAPSVGAKERVAPTTKARASTLPAAAATW